MRIDQFPSVAEFLSQGPSFRFIDAVIEAGDANVVAQRLVRLDDPVFGDHFPGNPIYPGVLLIEMMAQTASLIARISAYRVSGNLLREPGAIGKVKALSFFHPVRPGDMLLIYAERGKQFDRLAEFHCVITADSTRVASGALVLSAPGQTK